ncbi:hypothetical protein L6164_026631 [Bauhinia variegata]|uniref:Uncharacterized protein n=1 Tax=Bauhinia variegata TaxID=167791 RepID=A0ACB9LRB4_BAUVA|nr:hypothetical protein L6164_026631 [Bauhinia variegata]
MRLSSVASSNEAVQFCIFDLRRGQNEEQELDKILFFFPAGLPLAKQLSVTCPLSGNPKSDGFLTLGSNDCLLDMNKVTRGKELYMVLEKANETLLYASDAVEKFSNRYCNGAFSLD